MRLPLLDAPLCVRVEVLFLLVQQGLSLQTRVVRIFELLHSLFILNLALPLSKLGQLKQALPLLLFLLLLSSLQLLIAHTPELGVLLLLILYCRAFGLQLLNL